MEISRTLAEIQKNSLTHLDMGSSISLRSFHDHFTNLQNIRLCVGQKTYENFLQSEIGDDGFLPRNHQFSLINSRLQSSLRGGTGSKKVRFVLL